MVKVVRAVVLAMLMLGGALLAVGPASAAPSVFYPNCAFARAAGATNIPRGSDGYRLSLDADQDGIACESRSGSSASSTGTETESPGTGSSKTQAAMPSGGTETGDGSYPLSGEPSTGWSGADTVVVIALGAGVLAYSAAASREPRRR